MNVNLNNVLVRTKAYNLLKEEIIKGTFEPGERIVEIALSEKLGISRTPLREALHLLEREGFLTRLEKKGLMVSAFSEQETRDLYSVRSNLEGLAVRIVTESINERQKKRLQKLINEIDGYCEKGDEGKAIDKAKMLHSLIREFCNNQVCVSFLQSLDERIARYKRVSISESGRQLSALSEHRNILQLILEGDADRAEEAMKCHIMRSVEVVVKRIRAKTN